MEEGNLSRGSSGGDIELSEDIGDVGHHRLLRRQVDYPQAEGVPERDPFVYVPFWLGRGVSVNPTGSGSRSARIVCPRDVTRSRTP